MVIDCHTLRNIESFRVLHHIGMSDHECLLASIKTKGFRAQASERGPGTSTYIIKRVPFKYITPEKFVMKLRSPLGKERLQHFIETYKTCDSPSMESLSSDFVQLIAELSKANPNKRIGRKKVRNKYLKKKSLLGTRLTVIKLRVYLTGLKKTIKRTHLIVINNKSFSLPENAIKKFAERPKENLGKS